MVPTVASGNGRELPRVRRAIPLTTRTGQERNGHHAEPDCGKGEEPLLLVELNMVDRLQAISRDESEWQAQATLKEIMKGWPRGQKPARQHSRRSAASGR